jgi:hypothetical protein
MYRGVYAYKNIVKRGMILHVMQNTGGNKLFLRREKNVRKKRMVANGMKAAVITEFAGTRREIVTRIYQYGGDGVRVYTGNKVLRRLYLFDSSSDTMTERDIAHQDRVIRRFIFDRNGMLEETFSFGQSPRTYRYENGGRQIVEREGGKYGAASRTYTFEGSGVAETEWGRDGAIGRVWIFEPGNDAIMVRRGGWYGDIERTLICEGIEISVFREPEAFLQFLMFTEEQPGEADGKPQGAPVSSGRGPLISADRSKYAFTGIRHTQQGSGNGQEGETASHGTTRLGNAPPVRPSVAGSGHEGIDFIPEGDAPQRETSHGSPSRPSSDIPFDERRNRSGRSDDPLSPGRSAEIPLEERFESARREREKLSRGKSANIPYDERRNGGDR